MSLTIIKGTEMDIDELELLYNDLIDALTAKINYPGWIKGIYPTRADAQQGLEEGSLFVARDQGRIVGTIQLNHTPEPAYETVDWQSKVPYDMVYVIHTFAVHPDYLKSGIGKRLMEFAEAEAAENGIKYIRLDVYEKNTPAIRLYRKCGYRYLATIDLGYGRHGLYRFEIYEKEIVSGHSTAD